MNKNKRVTIRLTDDEHQQIKVESFNNNLTLSDYARQKILTGRVKKGKSKCTQELLFEINKIGNNLNQVARNCNAFKSVDIATLQTLTEIEKKLNLLLEKI
jgi:uncharacterized protein YcgI (DUF1989 family)